MEINGEFAVAKECPHCGESYYLSMKMGCPDDFGAIHYVQCDSCLSRGPVAGSEKAALQNWNCRSMKVSCSCLHGNAEFLVAKDTPF